MNHCVFIFSFMLLILSVTVIYLPKTLIELSEKDTCNFCYGDNLCSAFETNKIFLQYNTLSDLIFNLVSVKNVFYGQYLTENVVIKKLGNKMEVARLDEILLSNNLELKVIKLLKINEEFKDFLSCDEHTSRQFLNELVQKNYNLKQVWTILQINVEPLLLDIFNKNYGWPVPKLFGYCGRFAVMENCGRPLNTVENYSWFDRAYIALQLLEAAKKFTIDHKLFRLYLTDISPDNISVDRNLKISFIDLENAVLATKKVEGDNFHYSEYFEEDAFVFSQKKICECAVSDHNIYSVCKTLLSIKAPWPMMKNGLVHSPPHHISVNYSNLFSNIELCVYSENRLNRFQLCDNMLKSLKKILLVNGNYVRSKFN